MSTIESLRRLFVVNTVLLIFTSILPYIVPYIYPDIPRVYILVISSIIMTILVASYCFVFVRLTFVIKGMVKPAELLAEKMMSCKLRIKNGLDYCVKCPEGYTCASGKGK